MSRFAFKLPDLGEGTVEAELVAWHVAAGEHVREGQPIAEVSTEKAVVDVPSPVDGTVHSLHAAAGQKVAVGSDLVTFLLADEATAVATPPAATIPRATPTRTPAAAGETVRTSPSIRRRAREAGIDLENVSATGPDGRVTQADFDRALRADKTPRAATARAPAVPAVAVSDVEEVPMTGVRRIIAERMSLSKRTIPHFSYVEEVDVTELEALRTHLNADARDDRLTLLPFVVAALVPTLAEHRQCNAHYDGERQVLRRFRAVHVGIATQTPDGLKVPVLRNAQDLALDEIAAGIRDIAAAARSHGAPASLFSGSTVTVSSLGALGGIASTPILNAPEVSIIGLNRASPRPVVRDGAVTVRTMMNLSSSFDHRVIGGADAAGMIQRLKERLEHPSLIFANLRRRT